MKTIEEIRKAFLAMHHNATKENAPTYKHANDCIEATLATEAAHG